VKALMGDLALGHFVGLSGDPLRPRPLTASHAAQRDRHPDGHRARLELRQRQLRRLRALRNGGYDGQVFAIFVIMLAAAEAAIGLAIVLGIYQSFETIDVEATDRLRLAEARS
jgi:hypothetical protein